jgi:B12-binding domain/radical SAM domain protein of rhizo-twelve system
VKVALVNPRWTFEHSIYFGCREPHLPLELAYAEALLKRGGHETLFLDGHLFERENDALAEEVTAFEPHLTVVPTAPSYLFWRCAPPELRVPRDLVAALAGRGGMIIAIGPHGSATPGAALRKLGVDAVIRGESEEAILDCADRGSVEGVAGIARFEDGALRLEGVPRAAEFCHLPPLSWPDDWVKRHRHHHHRFGTPAEGLGAEVEASRGCPYSCSFCAKIDYRDRYRRRNLEALLAEIDRLCAQGVRYLYFIDEIFLPQRALLEALIPRRIAFGVQTRLDLWKPEMIDLLGAAGCVSIEAGVESLTEEGREALDKDCRLSTEALTERLLHARRRVPFVQANLIKSGADDPTMIAEWRRKLERQGVWANDPVPLYPYPSSPDYRRLWGEPDDSAWERAHAHYLSQFDQLSDIQEQRPLSLRELEASCLPG